MKLGALAFPSALPGAASPVHPAWMKLAPIVALLLAIQPRAALACSLIPDTRPVEVQLDEWTRSSYSKAQAMVEIVAVEGSRRSRPGVVRIVRVLKGPIRPGRLLSLHTIEPSLCGAGGFRSGSRGLILLDRLGGRLVFNGYLSADYLTRLDRLGLRPLDRQETKPAKRSKQ